MWVRLWPPDSFSEETLGHCPSHTRSAFCGLGSVRAAPAALDGVGEDLEPAIEDFGSERRLIVEMAVVLDGVDVVSGGVEQHVTPIVGDRADVGLPVDESGFKVEVGLENSVLSDIDVLTGDHLEDLLGCVEVTAAVLPRPQIGRSIGGDRSGDHRCVRFAEKLNVKNGVG